MIAILRTVTGAMVQSAPILSHKVKLVMPTHSVPAVIVWMVIVATVNVAEPVKVVPMGVQAGAMVRVLMLHQATTRAAIVLTRA